MSQKTVSDLYVTFLMFASIFTLFLIGVFTVNPPFVLVDHPLRRPVIGAIYSVICILGITATLFPKPCSTIISHNNHIRNKRTNLGKLHSSSYNNNTTTSLLFGLKIVHGHHPDCEHFSGHELKIREKIFCIGCLGLSIGALISLTGAIFYFFYGWQIGKEGTLVILGILGVAFSLLTLYMNKTRGFPRLFLNVLLVVGSLFILIGVDRSLHSIVMDLYTLIASIYWVWTRIALSSRNHTRICKTCGFRCFTNQETPG